VLILGGAAASIALYAVAFARGLGSGRVRYVDRDEARCAAAVALGAEVEHQQGAWPRRYERAPITVEATGELEGLHAALRSTDDYGFCTSVAIHFSPTTPLPLLEMYTHGITFHVSRADSRRLLPAVIELFADRRFDPLSVPTTIAPWERADEVWLEPATKLVLERD
jgi:alcohol dehydrogenase